MNVLQSKLLENHTLGSPPGQILSSKAASAIVSILVVFIGHGHGGDHHCLNSHSSTFPLDSHCFPLIYLIRIASALNNTLQNDTEHNTQ